MYLWYLTFSCDRPQATYGKLSDYRDIAPLLGNEDAEAGELVVVADRNRSCGDTHVLLGTQESIAALHALNPEEGVPPKVIPYLH